MLREFYRQVIQLRRELPALSDLNKENLEVVAYEQERVLSVRRWNDDDEVCVIFSFRDDGLTIPLSVPAGHWCKRLDTSEERWLGSGSTVPATLVSPGEVQITLRSRSCVLFERL